MQNNGPVDRDGWDSFVSFCENQRRRIFAQLEPLEEGTIHTGRRGPDTGGKWIDTTNEDIQRLRKDVANIDTALTQARARRR
jgi:hypothetical protein